MTLALIIYYVANYIDESFYNITIDQLIYSLTTAEGTSSSMIINGVKYVLPRVLLIYGIIIVFIVFYKFTFHTNTYLKIKIRNKGFNMMLSPLSGSLKIFCSFIILLISFIYVYGKFDLSTYFNSNRTTNFFDIYYTDPKNIAIEVPKKKQNLIYIYVESLESSLFSSENGGNFKESIIPNLEQYAEDNINFSMDDKLGGGYAAYGATWTIAGMVASSAGVPLKLPTGLGNLYSGYGEFLPGVYSLGEVLEKNGYKNYLMIGSQSGFGGRGDYFTYHGDYEIMDYEYAIKNGYIDEDYNVWWGYEDGKLFEFAKEELTDIAKNDEPFNFTLLTSDTHATDGYLEDSCDTPFDERYLNVYNCSDSMIYDFVKWVQEQDFYDDTTIVITGDHLSMQGNMSSMFEYYNGREVYNAFINSVIDTDNNKNRLFTTFDFYPTTLAALGFKIDGNRLGLGTNLFSSRQTLAEEVGSLDTFDEELSKKSDYYNNVLLGDSYEKLKNTTVSES